MTTNLKSAYTTKHGTIVTPMGRMIYAKPFEKTGMPGAAEDAKRFGVTLMIHKDSDIEELKSQLTARKNAKFPGAKNVRTPILKTDESDKLAEYAEEYPYYLRLRSKFDVEVVGPNHEKITAGSSEVYDGRWGRAEIKLSTYDTQGNKGLSLNLIKLQLLRHGDPIRAAGASAEDTFEAVEDVGTPPAKAEAPSDDDWM